MPTLTQNPLGTNDVKPDDYIWLERFTSWARSRVPSIQHDRLDVVLLNRLIREARLAGGLLESVRISHIRWGLMREFSGFCRALSNESQQMSRFVGTRRVSYSVPFELRADASTMLACLDTFTQSVLRGRFEGATFNSVAAMLAAPIKTVQRTYHSGIAQLASLFHDYA